MSAEKARDITDGRIHNIGAKALTDANRQGKHATALAGHSSVNMSERYIRLRESPVVSGPSAFAAEASDKTA
jgi:hypothetical protein